MNAGKLVDFIVTFLIAAWVMYRLGVDSKSTIDAGWDTTLVSQEFQTIKLILLISTGLFFIRRLFVIISQIKQAKN
jgi:hypothetical protein